MAEVRRQSALVSAKMVGNVAAGHGLGARRRSLVTVAGARSGRPGPTPRRASLEPLAVSDRADRRPRALGRSPAADTTGGALSGGRRGARHHLDDPEAQHGVVDPQAVREGLEQRRRPVELDQVVLALALVADLVGQRPRAPVVVALDRAAAAGDLGLDVGQDLGAPIVLDEWSRARASGRIGELGRP